MVFVCGECGEEYGVRTSSRYDETSELMLKLHLDITGHCNQSAWAHNSYTQRELKQRFEESLTRKDVDLLREYGVKV